MITLTENQKRIIKQLNDSLYTISFLEEWLNRQDNVFTNAPAALQTMGAQGFYRAILAIEKRKETSQAVEHHE